MIKKIIIGALVGILLVGIPAVVYLIKQQQVPKEEEITPIPTITPIPPPSTLPPAIPTPSETLVTTDLPVCSELTLNRLATGTAPFTIRFTAKGEDSDGVIEMITFRFGDGQVDEMTVGGGIGTNSVSVQATHTYTTAGTFPVEAILTDDQGGASAEGECSQVITVTAGTGTGVTVTPTATPAGTLITLTPTKTPTPTTIKTPTPTIEEPGSEIALGLGGLAAILLIIGAFLFFAL